MIKRLFFLLLTVTILFSPLIAVGADTELYVSDAHEFSVQYPKSWSRGSVVHKQTVLRVESPDGDDFNIVVITDNSIKGWSPEEFSKYMFENAENIVLNSLAPNYPDVKLVSKGITNLSQQPAMYYTADFSLSAAGTVLPYHVFAISTKYKNKIYTLTFRTLRQFYNEYRATIQFIILSFQLTKVKQTNHIM